MAKKLTGLKKAVGDYKRYNSGGYYSPEYGYLMLNRDTGRLWTDYFYSLGHNMWSQYDNKSIINLGAKMDEREIAINMKNVKEFAERLVY